MNELIIGGIVAGALLTACVASVLLDNLERIGEWLFDIGTAYYLRKARRARRNNKQYF